MTITESRLNEMHDAGYPLSIAHFRILEDTGEMALTYNNSRSAEKYGRKPKYTLCGGKTGITVIKDL